jgi:lysophospholipase L1-like esterase
MTRVSQHAHRPSLLGRAARILLPGVRHVQAQIAPYAALWDDANAAALDAVGPLWVVLGDSTAQGIGAPSYDQGYVGQLRRRLDDERGGAGSWRVLNWSRSGARVEDVLRDQLPRLDALGAAPDLVTCAIGANDIYRTPLNRILAGMRAVIRRLPAGAVIATIPQGLRPQKAVAVSDLIRTEAPAAGLVVADVWARTGPPWRGKFAEDNFHPGVAGYADWAAAFADALGLSAKTGG